MRLARCALERNAESMNRHAREIMDYACRAAAREFETSPSSRENYQFVVIFFHMLYLQQTINSQKRAVFPFFAKALYL